MLGDTVLVKILYLSLSGHCHFSHKPLLMPSIYNFEHIN